MGGGARSGDSTHTCTCFVRLCVIDGSCIGMHFIQLDGMVDGVGSLPDMNEFVLIVCFCSSSFY